MTSPTGRIGTTDDAAKGASIGRDAVVTTQLRTAPTSDDGSGAEPAPVGWPLVERRRAHHTPPMGIERRGHPADASAPVTLSAAPLWPFRLGAAIAGVARAITEVRNGEWAAIIGAALVCSYAVATCIKPVPYRNDTKVRLRIVTEMALHAVIVLLTGSWSSPFTQCIIPTVMLAGFAAGGLFSGQLVAATVAALTVQHVDRVDVTIGLRDGALWTGWLALVAYTSGLAHRAAVDAAQQQQLALDRVSRLAEANSLLFSLQRVAQALPASLDLDEVLDSTVNRVRAMIRHDAIVIYGVDGNHLAPLRTTGATPPRRTAFEDVPVSLRVALESPKTIRRDNLPEGEAATADAVSGLYCALRARGRLVGLIAVESRQTHAFGQQDTEVLHGLSEPFGIAMDNARMFRQIRTLAADEERSRIARELHDHIGSSLAMIGYEIDRATSVAADGGNVHPTLVELRSHVSSMVGEVREALHDLRTDVTIDHDIASVLRAYCDRLSQRRNLQVDLRSDVNGRVPLPQEREAWHVVREALTNAERHAQASSISVRCEQTARRLLVVVRDNGVGISSRAARPDSYGLVGMRERAESIGAALTITEPPGGGTEVQLIVFARS